MSIQTFIYFPTDKKPVIVFADAQIGNEYRGSTILKEIMTENRFSFYPVKRCQPFSDELYQAVQDWLSDREELDDRYERLMKKGLKAIIPANTSASRR